MQVEIVAIGTELLLGQIIDTNSSWVAERLAGVGIDCYYQTRVGDNVGRIVSILQQALQRSDAVIVCGGLGPTQDDVTRDALAAVMGVELRRDGEGLRLVEAVFASRARAMSPSNLRQADVPDGARLIPQVLGTAPGLICPIGEKVIYAVPGVPRELYEMIDRAVLPDLLARSGERSVILSRTLRTWGLGESRLGEMLAPHMEELDAAGNGAATIAFLASGIEGIKVRVTVKAIDVESAQLVLNDEEKILRDIIGDAVFGVDEQTIEYAVGALLRERGWTLGVGESFTGGLISSRMVAVPGASDWFRGGVVSYASEVKFSLLGVPRGPVVTGEVAIAMASGARRLLGATVGISTTGVAGPSSQEGHEPGTAFVGIDLGDDSPEFIELHLTGDRSHVREIGTISLLDAVRRRLARTA